MSESTPTEETVKDEQHDCAKVAEDRVREVLKEFQSGTGVVAGSIVEGEVKANVLNPLSPRLLPPPRKVRK